MLRRTSTRSISAFTFGHPTMDQGFLPKDHHMAKNAAVDQGVQVLAAANGARIVTHNRQGAQTSIGVYVLAGAKQDPKQTPGLNYVLRWALPGSNLKDSLFQMSKTQRAVGAAFEHCDLDKKWLGWKVEAVAANWQKPVEDLFTCMAIPRFPEYDTERYRDTMDNLLEEARWQSPREYCVDNLETVSFFKEPLGNPRFVPPSCNDECSHEALLAQWAKLCVPSRIVIAGINIDADELAAAYEHAPFQHSASAPHHAAISAAQRELVPESNEAAQYFGGTERHESENRAVAQGTQPDMDEEAIVAVGYRTNGRENLKKFSAARVLSCMVDSASCDAVRSNRMPQHFGQRGFFRPFHTAGLMGFTARERPENIGAAVKTGLQSVSGLDTSKASVDRAIQMAKVSLYHSYMDTNRDALDFLVSNLAAGSSTAFTTLEEHLDAISSVTPAEVKKALDEALSAKPTLFATGKTYELPSLKQMQA